MPKKNKYMRTLSYAALLARAPGTKVPLPNAPPYEWEPAWVRLPGSQNGSTGRIVHCLALPFNHKEDYHVWTLVDSVLHRRHPTPEAALEAEMLGRQKQIAHYEHQIAVAQAKLDKLKTPPVVEERVQQDESTLQQLHENFLLRSAITCPSCYTWTAVLPEDTAPSCVRCDRPLDPLKRTPLTECSQPFIISNDCHY